MFRNAVGRASRIAFAFWFRPLRRFSLFRQSPGLSPGNSPSLLPHDGHGAWPIPPTNSASTGTWTSNSFLQFLQVLSTTISPIATMISVTYEIRLAYEIHPAQEW